VTNRQKVDPILLEADVLVVGGGAAGMFAALAAARGGANVILFDKNVAGRGGATIMAQMTLAAALGEAEPDSPELHLQDMLASGKGLCNEDLAELLCEGSPQRIRELVAWNVNFARQEDGRINQVKAPGHSRRRCVYVDFLSTGVAISAALRIQTSRSTSIKTMNNFSLTDVVTRDGEVIGGVGFDVASATPVFVKAPAVVLCLGGMMKLFSRTTAPNNNAGEGIGIALRAGARLVDIEFLQFYPNGHLAPRMVGLDPTTWEPTRVKLGGRLLNADHEEFLHKYGDTGGEGYNTTRDLLSHAIYKEVEAGRGAPHGGVYLSFQHLDADVLTKALGPFIDIFKRNNIDLTKQPVEIFPIAHYQMGGIEVNARMESTVTGLYAAGEITGGANGANRLSGNALPEAMVFGARAGECAAKYALEKGITKWDLGPAKSYFDVISSAPRKKTSGKAPVNMLTELKQVMWDKVGVFRKGDALVAARDRIRSMRRKEFQELSISSETVYSASLVEWFELRSGLYAAEAAANAAIHRRESRGAHQRTDFPETLDAFQVNQRMWLANDELRSSFEDMRP
jgi:succinate dehydrogenase/fumarate reductase flavoprotein subunit